MTSLLGPLPLLIYQHGKYFNEFHQFCGVSSRSHGEYSALFLKSQLFLFVAWITMVPHCRCRTA